MMVDGEEVKLIVSYSKKIWQLRSDMGKFKAIAKGGKSLAKTTLFPFFFYNHYNDIKVAVMLEKDPPAFNVDVEGTAWDEIEYFAPTRSIADDNIDPFAATIRVNDQELLGNDKALGWRPEKLMAMYEAKCNIRNIRKLHM